MASHNNRRGNNQSKRGAAPSADAGPSTPSSSRSSKPIRASKRGGKRGTSSNRGSAPSSRARSPLPPKTLLEGPFHDESFIKKEYHKSGRSLRKEYEANPKSPLHNFYAAVKEGEAPKYESVQGTYIRDSGQKAQIWRTTVELDIEPRIVGIGDNSDKKQSGTLAALSALYQLHELQLLDNPRSLVSAKPPSPTTVTLSDGTIVDYEKARSFMDYYCRRFDFSKPEIDFQSKAGGASWEAVLTVGGRKIGMGTAPTKKISQVQCYLDVVQYLDECDQTLWNDYTEAARTGKDLGMAPKVVFTTSPYIEHSIEDLCHDIRRSVLYRNRPRTEKAADEDIASKINTDGVERGRAPTVQDGAERNRVSDRARSNHPTFTIKSKKLQERRQTYLHDAKLQKMRETRASLPVYTQSKDVLQHIAQNEVTICMAATGSGKTTQIPQMILDQYIDAGKGAECNIVCTQPRRLAAISVAHRVASERGEQIGMSVGYHVRFEAKLPEPRGSITFCTTGVFLKRLQSIMSTESNGRSDFDSISHIVVDEVHERDVDTDLLLVVLKQLMEQKKAKGQSLKIILMSATIDPILFQRYFADHTGKPADTIEVPGRSFPVTKHFMDDYATKILSGPMKWVKDQEPVAKYLLRELGPNIATQLGVRVNSLSGSEHIAMRNDLDLPYPFIAATISHVLQASKDGHVLVFLPGWEEIMATQRALLSPLGPLGINLTSKDYSLHLLHSSVPLADQQAIFEPPKLGVRRIILATNIAETSVTIPDVVYVIDSAKIKEQRYDPDRHMSSLVSSWVGSSNVNQRAGRAGRHRSGEYYGILGRQRADRLDSHQLVEMKRVDLSNVVMHVKALNLPVMTVEEVLAAAIEPPDPTRVEAAMRTLQMVGALDSEKSLTSLGRVLLQIPVDVQVGRLVLYGCFFRCLDQALTLAAILTNREPFVAPMHVRTEAQRAKNSWSPENFHSDVLAAMNAYNSWWEIQSRGDYAAANRFCSENFLSKPTLLLIQKVRSHLLQSLYRAGVIEVSAGGELDAGEEAARRLVVPAALNANKDSMPLMTALIAIASQPKFAIKKDSKSFRTQIDKFALVHPSSVNNRKREVGLQGELGEQSFSGPYEEKRLYAFSEKRRNDTGPSGPASISLVTTTRLDPLVYILFGAYNVEVVQGGLECDDWLPIKGDLRTLDDIWRLKTSMEASMLRVFEGITMSRQRKGQTLSVLPRQEEGEAEWESGEEDAPSSRNYSLSREEMRDLDHMTRAVVSLLNAYSDERIMNQSAANSRAGTPSGSPFFGNSRLPSIGGYGSGYSTPFYQSRPGTPSRLRRADGRF
ncbi:hypothetical protein CPB83DRAFT_770211 [Crepidotus variabilis]|uniref:P-loop containing nucleoside triphosphate hydrolase protein n=1 Tax=Crepidotus variabilis TaxID=179855 RepID=A0A9P6ECI8_9AGAR|nr:hypothetical protein CPB83DRAFT_770211 [Crepidotus variabilis]